MRARRLTDKLSPTLRHDIEAELTRMYRITRKRAAVQLQKYGERAAAQSLPAECPYTIDQILAEDWYPDPAADPNDNTGSGDTA